MKVKNQIEIEDMDIQSITGINQDNSILKVISSVTCGTSSRFVFGIAKSIPIVHDLKKDDNTNRQEVPENET